MYTFAWGKQVKRELQCPLHHRPYPICRRTSCVIKCTNPLGDMITAIMGTSMNGMANTRCNMRIAYVKSPPMMPPPRLGTKTKTPVIASSTQPIAQPHASHGSKENDAECISFCVSLLLLTRGSFPEAALTSRSALARCSGVQDCLASSIDTSLRR